MGTRRKFTSVPAKLDQRVGRVALFGAAPLITGEDGAAYQALNDQIAAAVKPSDIIEEIWLYDVVDLTWECFRLRRLKASLMNAAAPQGLEIILQSLIGPTEALALASEWAARDTNAIKQVGKLLASAGMTMDAVMAETLSIKLGEIERIDRMIALAEARRNAVLREVDRHRDATGRHLRRAVDEVEDVEFKDIDEGLVPGTAPA